MGKHVICPSSDLEPGERTIVEVEGLSIGVFNVDGEYHALNNACPHQLAPLCEGTISGTAVSDTVGEYEWTKEGEIIRCPWHNWEFDIATGESVFNPHRVRAGTFEVGVESAEEVGVEAGEDVEVESAEEASVEVDSKSGEKGGCADCEEYGTELAGDAPPVETYSVEVESEMVVLYV